MAHRNPCLPCRDSSFSSGRLGLEPSPHTDDYIACMKTGFILQIAKELSDDVLVKSLLNDNESKEVVAWKYNTLALNWHYQEL
jgi:hypothetical protein